MSIFNHFRDIKLGEDQDRALSKIEAFLNSQQQVFMLKGYAGSGKTTILKGLIEYFTEIQKGYVLMAPTGRAAKIIREKTGVDANTVHKSIYSFDDLIEIDEGGSYVYSYKIRNNSDVVGKVFIVDEASL
jgi:ATP-dependent exoDNAse (exonuclease V) alpha subunit